MNCFMDSGEGENFENLSTSFGIPAEPFFSKSWANFMFPLLHEHNATDKEPSSEIRAQQNVFCLFKRRP